MLRLSANGWGYKRIATALRMSASGYLTVRKIVMGTHRSVRADSDQQRS